MASVEDLDARLAAQAADLARARAALETFASAANHDLNAPLRHIHMFADLIRRDQGEALDPAAADYLERILAAVTRSERLVAALVGYARLASTPPARDPVALAAALGAAVAKLGDKLTASDAKLNIGPLPEAVGDRAQLEQVFEALIDNALTHAGESRPDITVTALTRPGQVTVRISDTGPGLPEGKEEAAFEPLRRLNASADAPGEGMGLAVCRMVIENHGGSIGFNADHAPGLAVEFTLPQAP
jgi:light-regulated signal transduction histidine kinase (bacteriophytochrome)